MGAFMYPKPKSLTHTARSRVPSEAFEGAPENVNMFPHARAQARFGCSRVGSEALDSQRMLFVAGHVLRASD
jgi:hypothetical protein